MNGVLMPYVLASNAPAIGEKMKRLASHLELACGPCGDTVKCVIDWLVDLRQRLRIPHTTSELDISAADFPRIAALAVRDPAAPTNPFPITEDSAVSILEMSRRGANTLSSLV